MKKPGANGFSLIEVMVTVAIIGILGMIAYPSYTRYVVEARRSDATINLMDAAARQEKFFTNCGVYTNVFGGGSISACTGLGMGAVAGSYNTTDGYYQLTVTNLVAGPPPLSRAGGGGYTLSAAPVAGTPQFVADNAKCTTLTITNTGAKGATGTDSGPNGGRCWKK